MLPIPRLRPIITRSRSVIESLRLPCAVWAFPVAAEPGEESLPQRASFRGGVEVGEARKIYAEWQGGVGPTVVSLAGKGGDAESWSLVLDPDDPTRTSPGDELSSGLRRTYRADNAVFPWLPPSLALLFMTDPTPDSRESSSPHRCPSLTR